MQVHRYAERRRRLPERQKLRVVEILAPLRIARRRVAVDHRTLEAQARHGTIEFGGSYSGVLERDAGKSGVARRLRSNHVGEPIVDFARGGCRLRRIGNALWAWNRLRQDRHANAAGVHTRETIPPDVPQSSFDDRHPVGAVVHRCDQRLQVFTGARRSHRRSEQVDVLFDRDLLERRAVGRFADGGKLVGHVTRFESLRQHTDQRMSCAVRDYTRRRGFGHSPDITPA